jgi:hypothetical protein
VETLVGCYRGTVIIRSIAALSSASEPVVGNAFRMLLVTSGGSDAHKQRKIITSSPITAW